MKDVVFKILSLIVPMMLSAIREILTNEQFIKWGDKLLDWCERAIKEKEDWYDPFVLDLIGIVRTAANIPDLPD
ncbi:hypothetical protein GWN26_01960, partial [Candidatus Saccharibacteria bacterium]|nr:hypothetical protein [Calditrichia bacterium]NIV71441.1 hypothetical protein [Calditrichia bacterium]NIV97970.1 hypothetical protein [Candidatus Saccharibacteria bacterium]NIW78267.1 hypothetical protein [Calditrichia bacterium]